MYNAEKKFIEHWEKRREKPWLHYLIQGGLFALIVTLPSLLFQDEDKTWPLWKILLMVTLVLGGALFMGWFTFRNYEKQYKDTKEKLQKKQA